MTHLRIEQAEGQTEYMSAASIRKLYELCRDSQLDINSKLQGTCHISGGYAIWKSTLETMFPNFHLIMDKEYVPFNDPEFEAACVAAYSSDGVGMTMADFQAVTDNGPLSAFNGNDKITDMTEFKYFTNIPGDRTWSDQSWTPFAIYDLPNLTTICFPDQIEYIGKRHAQNKYNNNNYAYTGTFAYCPKLQNVHLPNELKCISMSEYGSVGWEIMDLTNTKLTQFQIFGSTKVKEAYLPSTCNPGSRSFVNCSNMIKAVYQEGTGQLIVLDDDGYDMMFGFTSNITLDLPSNTAQVHKQMFNQVSYGKFIIRATTPPTEIDDGNSATTNGMVNAANIDLYVPDASISLYQSNSIFSGFRNIYGLSQLPSSYDPTPPSQRQQS